MLIDPRLLLRFVRDRTGATAIEYGLIAALICVAAIGGMQNFGGSLKEMWGLVDNAVGAKNRPGP